MRPSIVLGLALLIASPKALLAQKLAPGAALPSNTGGTGFGGTMIAPGPARGQVEQEGPGGIPLAIGSEIPHQPPRVHHTKRGRNTFHRTIAPHLR